MSLKANDLRSEFRVKIGFCVSSVRRRRLDIALLGFRFEKGPSCCRKEMRSNVRPIVLANATCDHSHSRFERLEAGETFLFMRSPVEAFPRVEPKAAGIYSYTLTQKARLREAK